jgi:aminopeptidase N
MNDHHACCAHRRGGLAHGAEFASANATAHYPPDLRLVPQHLDISVHVHVDVRALDVSVATRVRAQVEGAAELTLNGIGFLDLVVTGARHRYDGQRIALVFDPPLKRDEERVVTVRYRVESPASGVLFSGPVPHRPNAARYAVTDHETERARHWLACVDLPAVRTSLTWRLRVPAGFTALANGATRATRLMTTAPRPRATSWRRCAPATWPALPWANSCAPTASPWERSPWPRSPLRPSTPPCSRAASAAPARC